MSKKELRHFSKEQILEIKNTFIYDKDTGYITRIRDKSGKVCNKKAEGAVTIWGYTRISMFGDRFYSHRFAWIPYHGKEPTNFIDHINGVKTDNRICNLRDVTRHQNMQNLIRPMKTNTSGYLGVSKHYSKPKTWNAFITLNNKTKNLGQFDSPEKAYQRYLEVKKLFHMQTIHTGLQQ